MEAIERVKEAIRKYHFETHPTDNCPLGEIDVVALADAVMSSLNFYYIQEGVGVVDKIDYSLFPYSFTCGI